MLLGRGDGACAPGEKSSVCWRRQPQPALESQSQVRPGRAREPCRPAPRLPGGAGPVGGAAAAAARGGEDCPGAASPLPCPCPGLCAFPSPLPPPAQGGFPLSLSVPGALSCVWWVRRACLTAVHTPPPRSLTVSFLSPFSPLLQKRAQNLANREFHKKNIKEKAAHLASMFGHGDFPQVNGAFRAPGTQAWNIRGGGCEPASGVPSPRSSCFYSMRHSSWFEPLKNSRGCLKKMQMRIFQVSR